MAPAASVGRRGAALLEALRTERFTPGNDVRLLFPAAPYFAALVAALDGAQHAIHFETYIFADDSVGRAVLASLERAALRGVAVRLLVDGFGAADFVRALSGRARAAGVEVRVFVPPAWWRPRRRLLRRLHRKIVVIDERLAYVGGINVNDEPGFDAVDGEPIGPRLDVAVQCEGPIVAAIADATRRLWWIVGVAHGRSGYGAPPRRVPPGRPRRRGVRAAFVVRDNLRNRHSVERSYLRAIARARREILIANAYFLPGRRFLRALVRAARRGVRVRLLLQGRVEYRLQHHAQRALYGRLLAAGVEIHEYRSSYLHAKAAVVDGRWSTVGSSNIDPLSLLLAREANVVVRDRAFCARLRACLDAASLADSLPLRAQDYAQRAWPVRLFDGLCYALVRAATVLLARGYDY